ncbi:MAG: hypothetical protein J6C93_06480 [Clostridia bacterium]|nr:hypothetical protein [Clostridia bacterium]
MAWCFGEGKKRGVVGDKKRDKFALLGRKKLKKSRSAKKRLAFALEKENKV